MCGIITVRTDRTRSISRVRKTQGECGLQTSSAHWIDLCHLGGDLFAKSANERIRFKLIDANLFTGLLWISDPLSRFGEPGWSDVRARQAADALQNADTEYRGRHLRHTRVWSLFVRLGPMKNEICGCNRRTTSGVNAGRTDFARWHVRRDGPRRVEAGANVAFTRHPNRWLAGVYARWERA